jgi:hypothetical protein
MTTVETVNQWVWLVVGILAIIALLLYIAAWSRGRRVP